MVQLNGYIKIHRKLVQWGWYQDTAVKSVFLHLLIIAAFKTGYFMGQEIKAGQAVIGYSKLAAELGLSTQQVRTALKKLESTGEISRNSTNKFTIVTIANWEEYQSTDDFLTNEQHSNNKRITNEQHSNNIPSTNEQQHLKNVKKVKKVKNDKNVKKNIYGEYDNVLLTSSEFSKLVEEYQDYQERIDRLSGYIASKGDKYKSHYATIRMWAAKDNKADKKGDSFLGL